jgi:hypothetical protein
MNSINLNYLRGLYDFLFNKTDEELENFDINSAANQRALFDFSIAYEMPTLIDLNDVALVDEIGPTGLDYSK